MNIFLYWVSTPLAVLIILGLLIIKLGTFHIKRSTLKTIFWIYGILMGTVTILQLAFLESFPFMCLISIIFFLLCLEEAFEHTANPDEIYTLNILHDGYDDFFDENHHTVYIQYIIGTITEGNKHIYVKLYAPNTKDFNTVQIMVKSTGHLKNGYLIVREVDKNGTFISKQIR